MGSPSLGVGYSLLLTAVLNTLNVPASTALTTFVGWVCRQVAVEC